MWLSSYNNWRAVRLKTIKTELQGKKSLFFLVQLFTSACTVISHIGNHCLPCLYAHLHFFRKKVTCHNNSLTLIPSCTYSNTMQWFDPQCLTHSLLVLLLPIAINAHVNAMAMYDRGGGWKWITGVYPLVANPLLQTGVNQILLTSTYY